jgi:acyl-coenzyme A synthetase/AMP-(fatty) acid ligase
VGEPINEEAWHWYNNHVGDKKCPVVDTWWQPKPEGIMISPIAFVTPTKPTLEASHITAIHLDNFLSMVAHRT